MPEIEKLKNKRERTPRLFAAGACILIGAVVGTIYWALRTSYESYSDRANQAAQILAQIVGLTVETEIRLIDNALVTVVQALEHASRYDRTGPEALKMIVSDQLRLVPQVDAIRVTDENGLVLNTGQADDASVADRDYFEQARRGQGALVISEPQQGRVIQKWGMVLARAIISADGKFLGVVYAVVSSAHFVDTFDDVKIGPRGTISLRSGTLRLIARYTPETAKQELGLGASNISYELRTAISQSPNRGLVISKAGLEGSETVLAYQRVSGHPLQVLVGIDTDNYFGPWRKSASQLTGIGVFIVVLIVTVIALLGRRQKELIASQAALNQLAAEQHLMLDNELVGIAKFHRRVFTWHNRALAAIFGYAPEELVGQSVRLLYLDDSAYELVGETYPRLALGERARLELPMRRKDGSTVWIDLSGVQLPDGLSMWVMVDISSVRAREVQATHLAKHDSLTGLANRSTLDAFLGAAIVQAKGAATRLAVVFIDLDGFKAINDAWGHEAGDRLLVEVSRRIQHCIRSGDVAARLGGDEFVVLLSEIEGPRQVEQVVSRMLDAIAEPVLLASGQKVSVGASAGVSLFPDNGTSKDGLLNSADRAMYFAKRKGKGRMEFTSDQAETFTISD